MPYLFSFTNITLAGRYSIAMPFLVQQELDGDEKILEFFYTIFPVGYAIACLVMGSFQKLSYRRIIFYICGAIAGIGLGVFGLGLHLYILVFAAFEIDSLIWTNLM